MDHEAEDDHREVGPPPAAAGQRPAAEARVFAVGPHEQWLVDAYADHQPGDDRWRPPVDLYDQW
ncbi:hypothetical protein [Mycolicibacterium llatzerense]|uniref:hypothetical protein n=1 Tax=Mycolicibacterium llatzerense TaxID=280871 RepID=UPI0008DE6B04|nr:hypothetical protein [Mycolicibacterium llatzerense]